MAEEQPAVNIPRIMADAIIRQSAYRWQRLQWKAANPHKTIDQLEHEYSERRSRFEQDLYWFPATLWQWKRANGA